MTVFCDTSIYLKFYCDILTTWADQGMLKKMSTQDIYFYVLLTELLVNTYTVVKSILTKSGCMWLG
jgi:hypothetical protein